MVEDRFCARCENAPAVVKCSCKNRFCRECFENEHLTKPRNAGHREVLPSKRQELANWALGKIHNLQNYAEGIQAYFHKDEATKWFGLAIEESAGEKITKLVETPRFAELIELSINRYTTSPKRQYPSLVSFVGETGAGKSTLIRLLIRAANSTSSSNDLEAPVSGSRSGEMASSATTGEVNLYFDPDTFGTESPAFFVDCEGLSGGEPLASKYQSSWSKYGKPYIIEARDGRQVDRDTAVKEIYPKFLYIFSDVVCMVTRNPRVSAELARKVLEWGKVGARNAVNQYSLPALIVIINGPTIEDPPQSWLSDDLDAATNSFFNRINEEINTNAMLQALAEENGVESMSALFERYYSSVHVCYVPLEGYGRYGSGDFVMQQVERLRRRILSDSTKVQQTRAKNWMRYDARLLLMTFRYAFEHLASRTAEPFDFNVLRQQAILPESTEMRISSFLNLCLSERFEANFMYASEVIASSLVRHALRTADIDAVCDPSIVCSADMKSVCQRAVEQFLDASQPCAFVDGASGIRCVNTKNGHAKGHQGSLGAFLADGYFVSGDFDASKFVETIETFVKSMLKDIVDQDMNHRITVKYLAKQHRDILQSAPNRDFWFPKAPNPLISLFLSFFGGVFRGSHLSASNDPCYGCLFGRPEYKLPCGHFICQECLIDFDQKEETGPHHIVIHRKCVLCAAPTIRQGYKIPVRPELSGLRILSLDGGGVRGIIQIVALQRLEALIGLNLPLGQFFDLIVGTSAGGLVALGLGQDKLSATQCIEKFKTICKTGFQLRAWAGLWRVLSIWFSGSIYQSDAIENALRGAYKPEELFGLRNIEQVSSSWPRVAVTTTVETDCWLLANYNQGDSKRYLKSGIATYEAARATSAAPLYFEPYTSDINGAVCRDGGLRENNPSTVALNESRELWGENAKIDLFLSLGSGIGNYPTPEPSGLQALPVAVQSPLKILLATMNGDSAWKRFYSSVESRIQRRARRLNPQFDWTTEPGLDAVGMIDEMLNIAKDYSFYVPRDESPFRAAADASTDALVETAHQLRASLYYFHLDSITRNMGQDIAVIKGHIYCRLILPEQIDAFNKLVAKTSGFKVNGTTNITMPEFSDDAEFKVPVSIIKKLDTGSVPVRIDAIFEDDRLVSISGFPTTIEELLIHSHQ